MADLIYLNGRIMAPSEAQISALDRGFLYGEALFETMRAYGGRIFRMRQHLARLEASALYLGLDLSVAQFQEPIERMAGKETDAYLRLTITRGVGRGLTAQPEGEPTVVIEAREHRPYPTRLYERGADLIISRLCRDERSPLSGHKLTNYVAAILAKKEAAAAGCDDALLLNNRDEVAEAAVANVFAVRRGAVVTPPLSAGILPGITRAVVKEICGEAGIPCAEETLSRGDVFAADEAFMTNTLMEIMPVCTVAERSIGDGAPGPITRELARRYRLLVEAECLS